MVAIIVWHKFTFVCAKSMTSQLVESSALSRRDYRQSAKKVEYAKGLINIKLITRILIAK